MYQSSQVKEKDSDSYYSDDELNNKNKKNSTMHMTNKTNNHKPSNLNSSSLRGRATSMNSKLHMKQTKSNTFITEKLYMPFIRERSYKLEVNNNISKIKEDSKFNMRITHKLGKRKQEVNKIGKEFIIYNNPSKIFYFLFLDINIDNISNITYNSIVKYIVNNHITTPKNQDFN